MPILLARIEAVLRRSQKDGKDAPAPKGMPAPKGALAPEESPPPEEVPAQKKPSAPKEAQASEEILAPKDDPVLQDAPAPVSEPPAAVSEEGGIAADATKGEVWDRVEEFRAKHQTSLLTLLFTDLVGSTALKQRFGDDRAVALIQAQRELVRSILREIPQSREVETAGDSFFCVFVKPSDAVGFSLRVQASLRRDLSQSGISMRIGIHLGEVVVEQREGGIKPFDLYGLQVDSAARVMSLAEGNQILCTRAVFDNARQVLKGRDIEGLAPLAWLNHGPYVMKGVEDPVEVCEVGEEGLGVLKAPGPSEKARPAGVAEEELGWRPSREARVPGTAWTIEEKVGEGGFGEAWLASNANTRETRVFKFCFQRERLHALKRELALFRVIREGIGEHPNIVRLHEVNLEGPGYYLGMEYVPGRNLRDWLMDGDRLKQLSTKAKLGIAAQVADALDAAHRAGVIHQDVKPENILVDEKSESLACGAPIVKLTDFGVGRVENEQALGKLGLTMGGTALMRSASMGDSGTLLYMAPERLEGHGATTRSDIYSLGVVLFQMLAVDLERAVTLDWESEVADPVLRGDLRKALAGSPRKRLDSAGRLAQLLKSWESRSKRRLLALRTGAALAALLLAGAFFGAWLSRSRSRFDAQQRGDCELLLDKAELSLKRGKVLEAVVYLAGAAEKARTPRLQAALTAMPAPLATFRRTLSGHGDYAFSAAFSPDGKVLASASSDRTIKLWDTATGKELATLKGHESGVDSVAFSPDGRWLASGSRDATIKLWDVAGGKELRTLRGHRGIVVSVAYSPDGRMLVSGSEDGTIRLWDPATGGELKSIEGKSGQVTCVAFSPDSGMVASAGDSTPRVWYLDGTLKRVLQGHKALVSGIAFSPDGRTLASGSDDKTIKLWNLETGAEKMTLNVNVPIWAVAFSPGGHALAAGGPEKDIQLWDWSRGSYDAAQLN